MVGFLYGDVVNLLLSFDEDPLGPTMSEFYVFHIASRIFKTKITKLKIYVRYIDDIFIATPSYDDINKLKQTLEKKSPY